MTGDFNASTWSRGFALVGDPADLINSQRGFGVQPSWPAGNPLVGIPIDHLIHSRELTTIDRHLGESLGSDHFPLIVTIGWAALQCLPGATAFRTCPYSRSRLLGNPISTR